MFLPYLSLLLFAVYMPTIALAKSDKPIHLDLIRQIFPDVKSDLSAQQSVIVRHIRNDYEADSLSGVMQISETGFYAVQNGKHRDYVLTLEVSHKGEPNNSWGGETLLALIRMQPHPHLLDVADIQMDRESGIWDKPSVLVGGAHDALVTYYSHFNSSADYLVPGIVEIIRDRFVQSKADLPMVYCVQNATAELHESLSFVLPKKAAYPIIFRLKVDAKKVDEDTQKILKVESKTFSIPLIQKNGRWHCLSAAATCAAVERMQERFGFSDN